MSKYKKNKPHKGKSAPQRSGQNKLALHVLEIDITVLAPFITSGYGATNYGVDMQVLRDANGKQVLPGSLIKGNIRHALTELLILGNQSGELSNGYTWNKAWINTWFGSESVNYLPRQGKLHFDFYWQHGSKESPCLLNRIALDEDGQTDEGSLAFIESAFEPGTEVTFSGSVRCFAASKAELKHVKEGLEKALAFIDAIGGLKSVGFGEITKTVVSSKTIEATSIKRQFIERHKEAHRFPFTINFDRPVCFPLRTGKGNRFETQERISGAVIKGALANSPNLSNTLKQHLDKVAFSFAYPSCNDERELPIKRSLVTIDDEELRDLAREPIDDLDNFEPFIAFQDDWKGSVFGNFERSPLKKTMVVRTAINSLEENDNQNLSANGIGEEYGTAKTGQLYSFVCIENTLNDNAPLTWRAFFDVSRVAESARKKVTDELIAILQEAPLFPMGKTHAVADIKVNEPILIPALTHLTTGQKLEVVLNSPAWLHHREFEAQSPTEDLTDHYAKQFRQLSQGSLTLNSLFTSQYLSGGEYIHARFVKGQNYLPHIITESGSVFVFEVIEPEKARQFLERWRCEGLPPVLSQWGTDSGYDEIWQENPYSRGNGYGEITVKVLSNE